MDNDSWKGLAKIKGKINLAMKNRCVVYSDFLDPLEVNLSRKLLFEYPDLTFITDGGYIGSERVVLSIFPTYIQFEKDDVPITAIRITKKSNNVVNETYDHRSVLGSLMALGIKREKIGDIIVNEDNADVVLHKETAAYILMFLEKVGHCKVTITEISLNELMIPEEQFIIISDTVSSLRLDSVLAAAIKKSRVSACEYIRSGKVKVNHSEIQEISKTLKENDLISVKGFGRVRFESLEGKTKKGNLLIKLKKYL